MFDCVLGAWQRHGEELRAFLISRLGNVADAEDLLQEVFYRSMRQGAHFCELGNPRAWLFQVARNLQVDRFRSAKEQVEINRETESSFLLLHDDEAHDPILALEECIKRNLQHLSPVDRESIEQCDLLGMKQAEFAEKNDFSLPAAKSRIQRARQKLREQIIQNCQVNFDEFGRVCCHKKPQE